MTVINPERFIYLKVRIMVLLYEVKTQKIEMIFLLHKKEKAFVKPNRVIVNKKI